MDTTTTTPPSHHAAGWCGSCREPVRLGETCCDEHVGWIGPDGLAWHDYDEYAFAVGSGEIVDARDQGRTVSTWVLELPSAMFIEVLHEADYDALIKRAYDEEWPDWRFAAAADALARKYDAMRH